jgi:hypothetical protein
MKVIEENKSFLFFHNFIIMTCTINIFLIGYKVLRKICYKNQKFISTVREQQISWNWSKEQQSTNKWTHQPAKQLTNQLTNENKSAQPK